MAKISKVIRKIFSIVPYQSIMMPKIHTIIDDLLDFEMYRLREMIQTPTCLR